MSSGPGSRKRGYARLMVCAICLYLATSDQEIRDAVTVAAGYAACEPHVPLAELVGMVNESGVPPGLSVLAHEGGENCGQCGRFLGADLGRVSDDLHVSPVCVACAEGTAA
jgi:hypothetical protein